MVDVPEADWYADYVLAESQPGRPRLTLNPLADWRGWWRVQARLAAQRHPGLEPDRRGFVLTPSELSAAGISRSACRWQVKTGAWTVPQRGTVAVVDPTAHPGIEPLASWEVARRAHAMRAAAAARCNPGFEVCGASAAVLFGLPTMHLVQRPILTSTAPRHRHFRIARPTGARPVSWYGIAVADPARTVVDLARHDRRDGIMAADAALRDGLVTAAALDSALARVGGWVGVRQARDIVALASPQGESPLESITRLALHEDGFPAPELQVPIKAYGHRHPYRVDMLWRAARLVLELDGRGKYTDRERWREKRRDRELERLGYRIERFTWAEVVDDWPRCSALLRALLAR